MKLPILLSYFCFLSLGTFLCHGALAQTPTPVPTPLPTPTPTLSAEATPSATENLTPAVPSSDQDVVTAAEPLAPAAPAKPTVPAPSLEKFNWPGYDYLAYPPLKNGMSVRPPVIAYSVDKTEDLILNGVVINSDSFKAWAGPLKKFKSKKRPDMDPSTNVVFFTIPQGMALDGDLHILSEDGKEIFTKSLTLTDLDQGKLVARGVESDFWGSANPTLQTSALVEFEEAEKTLLNPKLKSGFRFCLKKNDEKLFSSFCTPYYRYSKKDQGIKIQTQSSTTKVFVNKKESATEGTVPVESKKIARFLATSIKGFSVEFSSEVPELNLLDFYSDSSGQWIYLLGQGDYAISPQNKHFPAVVPGSLTDFFHWDATIGDIHDHWVVTTSVADPHIVLKGKGGGLFLYGLEVKSIPSESMRLRLRNPLKSSYLETPLFIGALPEKLEVKSAPKGGPIKLDKKGKSFAWKFSAPEKGMEQDSGFFVTQGNKEYLTNYRLFRGYSSEFSLRLAGVLSSDMQINFLGEAAYNQWFETLFGWENYYFGRQRWGLSARSFSPLSTFAAQGTKADLKLALATLDFKYRFTPGLWERDETWGAILGLENVSINGIQGSFVGTGFFWARSMPLLFDRIFNWFPFMEYPKWVDMEMIYYFQSLNQKVKPGSSPTLAVNFHGKILWTKRFFGEAGFGVKTYDYITTSQSIQLQALYGTAGLGFNF